MAAAIGHGQDLQMREIARVAYGVGLEAERSGLMGKLGKKRKYRKLKTRLRVLVGLALAAEAGFLELRMALPDDEANPKR
jgi:hypothetical protein